MSAYSEPNEAASGDERKREHVDPCDESFGFPLVLTGKPEPDSEESQAGQDEENGQEERIRLHGRSVPGASGMVSELKFRRKRSNNCKVVA